MNLGGSELIRAVVFSYAGIENKNFIQNQIQKALDAFRFVINIDSIEEVTKKYQNKIVFVPDIKWPGIYHLRLLAFTKSWKNSENLQLITSAIKKLIELSPIPNINGLYGSQVIAPASFSMNNFDCSIDTLKPSEWMIWFQKIELISRIIPAIFVREINIQIKQLKDMLINSSIIFKKRINHYYFHKWGPYTGLSLEKDWRSTNRYLSDMIFRTLLILHYSNQTY